MTQLTEYEIKMIEDIFLDGVTVSKIQELALRTKNDTSMQYLTQLKEERERSKKLLEALEGFIDYPAEDIDDWIEQNRLVTITVYPKLFYNAVMAITEYKNNNQ